MRYRAAAGVGEEESTLPAAALVPQKAILVTSPNSARLLRAPVAWRRLRR